MKIGFTAVSIKNPSLTERTMKNHLFYQTSKDLPFIEKANGPYIWDKSGKDYLDGSSGAIVCNLGYGNKKVENAIMEQAKCSFFAYRLHFENEPAWKLAEKLTEISADHLSRVYYVSGGSEAVETAMKLCRQYYYSKGETGKTLFISRKPSYHGCTLGALALTTYAPLEQPFRPLMQSYPKISAPYCYRCPHKLCYPECGLACAHELESTILEYGPDNIAAFIAEPVGGASTGAVTPPDGYFAIIEETCKKYGIMLILDEVMTGFGRTGKFFGYNHWNVKADIVAMSKGMASGYYPLGAVITTEEIVGEVLKTGFAHGHTYAGNPMACAVGIAVIDEIIERNLPDNAAKMGAILKDGLKNLAGAHSMIGDVRGKGLLLGIELVEERDTKKPFPNKKNASQLLADIAHDEGLIIYPRRSMNGLAGDHLVVAPPLIVTEKDINVLLMRLDKALIRTEKELNK